MLYGYESNHFFRDSVTYPYWILFGFPGLKMFVLKDMNCWFKVFSSHAQENPFMTTIDPDNILPKVSFWAGPDVRTLQREPGFLDMI